MASYEGEVVNDGSYRVRKLTQQARAMEETHKKEIARLQAIIAANEEQITELKATIKRYINNGVTIPKGRPRTKPAKPARKVRTK